MKQVYLFVALLAPVAAAAQSVGINAPTPAASAVLDVRSTSKGVSFPNVSLSAVTDATTIATPVAGLLVYNTNAALPCGTGLYFNNGSTTAPAWTCFTKSVQNFHAYDTGGRSTSSTTLTLQPGCSISITVPTGQTVDVKIDATVGATVNNTSSTAYSNVNAAIEVDNSLLAKGGYNSFVIMNSVNAYGEGSTTLSTWATSLTAGTHTIALYTSVTNGTGGNSTSGASTATIGGNATNSVNAGEIHATVYYR